jgi:dTDP-4-dehydrorhamnose reductase
MRAIVIGASGFIGRHLMNRLGAGQAVGTYHRRAAVNAVPFDGTNEPVSALLARVAGRFDRAFVLHGAIDTEACARDPAGTAAINVEGVWRVLTGLMDAGIKPVYVSTEYVFDGSRGDWRETDVPVPSTQYGIQKLEVERRLSADPRPSLTVRLSRVVGIEAGIHSVLGPWAQEIRAGKTMRCATDQIFSPAWVDDIAGALTALAGSGASGLYHLGGPRPFSRIELVRLLLSKIQDIQPSVTADIVPCSLHDLPFSEKRPLNTSIAIDKVQAVIDWRFKPMDVICADVARFYFGANEGSV